MFDKVKQAGELLKMRQQAMALQKQLSQITETYERDGMRVTVQLTLDGKGSVWFDDIVFYEKNCGDI